MVMIIRIKNKIIGILLSYTMLWIHFIFSTKNREPYLKKEIRELLYSHIREYAEQKGIHIDSIGGWIDHLHILVSLNKEQTISGVVHLIKGESSNWMNKKNICACRFEWQREYMALSVSHSDVEKVRKYIINQEEHHRLKGFTEEINLFLKNVFDKI